MFEGKVLLFGTPVVGVFRTCVFPLPGSWVGSSLSASDLLFEGLDAGESEELCSLEEGGWIVGLFGRTLMMERAVWGDGLVDQSRRHMAVRRLDKTSLLSLCFLSLSRC